MSKPFKKGFYQLKPGPISVVHPGAIMSLCNIASYTPDGCFVEVGVFRGGTAYQLNEVAREQNRPLYLYDTFEGIPYSEPEKGDGHPVGDFNDTSLEIVTQAIPDAIITKGVFPDSMIEMPPIAFVHVDCDQYRSITETVQALGPMMVKGGVMVFDDYGLLDGATKAINELYDEDQIFLTDFGKGAVIYT